MVDEQLLMRVPDFHNTHVRPCIAEFLGSMVFSLLVGLCGHQSPLQMTVYPLTTAGALLMAQTLAAGVSGAHFNPAITLSHFVHGRLAGTTTVCFLVVQFFGCFVGAVAHRALVSSSVFEDSFIGNDIVTEKGIDRVSRLQAFLLEAVLTSLLCLAHLQWHDDSDIGRESQFVVPAVWALITSIALPLVGQVGNLSLLLSQSLVFLIFSREGSVSALLYLNALSSLSAVLVTSLVSLVKREATERESVYPQAASTNIKEPRP